MSRLATAPPTPIPAPKLSLDHQPDFFLSFFGGEGDGAGGGVGGEEGTAGPEHKMPSVAGICEDPSASSLSYRCVALTPSPQWR